MCHACGWGHIRWTGNALHYTAKSVVSKETPKKQALAEEGNPRFRGFGSWTATANRDENDRGNGLMPGPTSVTAAFGF